MDLSGVIFVLLAVAWAGYLIPKVLKHHDEVARTRSIDKFSTALRVLARREPVSEPGGARDSRLVVTPRRRAAARASVAAPEDTSSTAETEPALTVTPAVPRGRSQARRAAARAAAKRRRRLLTFLLLCDAGVATAAYLAYVPWWATAVPGGLTLVYVVLCRTQVRAESRRDLRVLTEQRSAAQPLHFEEQVVLVPEAVPATPETEAAVEDTAGPTPEVQAALLPTADGGTLWDPLPVTLPTYVTKPKAQRTVRTIDLREPGTWTSGRTADDAEIAARASKKDDDSGEGRQRAVGS